MGIHNRPANCSSCDKRLSLKSVYYRNGKWFCNRRCWDAEQVKQAEEAAKEKPKEETVKVKEPATPEAPKTEAAAAGKEEKKEEKEEKPRAQPEAGKEQQGAKT